jgi:ferredoxin-NADP reductase/ferredoxin
MPPTQPPQFSTDIARVAFSMFVHVADIEKGITTQDVRRLQTLLKETAWIENDDVRLALFELRQNYSSFWADYEDKVFAADGETIVKELDRLRRELGDERSQGLRRELNRFLDRLDYGARLSQGDQRARYQARKELLTILKVDGEVLASIGSKDDRNVSEPLKKEIAPVVLPAAPPSPATNGNVWKGGRTTVRCVSVVSETHDTKTYSFAAEPKRLFHYKPGQFVTIELLVEGQILRRCYSISSSPTRPYTLSITVKRVPKGWMSNWLFDNMTEGVECTIDGPAGKFTCLDHPSEKLLFMIAGSGITPAMSMLRWLADTASKTDIVFINNVRTPDDIIFHQELLLLSTQLGEKMRLIIVPAALSALRPWHGSVGKINEMLLRLHAPDFAKREAFVCGPPGYTGAVKSLLASLAFPMNHYHDESFGGPSVVAPAKPAAGAPPRSVPAAVPTAASASIVPKLIASAVPSVLTAVPAAPRLASPPRPVPVLAPTQPAALAAAAPSLPRPLVAAAPTKTAKVYIEGSGASFPVLPEQTILEAAEASGVMLEHSCRSGVCGGCKMRKASGRVEMGGQTTLSESDIRSGLVLTCIGKAIGDVTLSRC